MVVVVIIGILVAIAVPVYNKVSENAEKNSCFANQRTIEGALESYRAGENTSTYPDVGGLVAAGYLKTAPKCPTTKLGYNVDTNTGKVGACSESKHGYYATN